MRTWKDTSLIEKKCAYCGKTFVPAVEHAYKKGKKIFCKYTCMLRYREGHPGKWAQKRSEEAGKKEVKK